MTAPTILTCYCRGTSGVLDLCLSAVRRHSASEIEVLVAVEGRIDPEGRATAARHRARVVESPPLGGSGKQKHGRLLDWIVGTREGGDWLILDSDCWPVRDGWDRELLDAPGAVVGIGYPWAPPAPGEYAEGTLLRRIRRGYCWERPWIACCLLRDRFVRSFRESGAKFDSGDDTGFRVFDLASSLALSVSTFKPLCGPRSETGLEPELNRERSVVYGNGVYHVGGTSRRAGGGGRDEVERAFGHAQSRVARDGDAAWLLDEGHRYRFDREEDAALFAIQRAYSMPLDVLRGLPASVVPEHGVRPAPPRVAGGRMRVGQR